MSFIDLATLALHRRTEMETRINVFVSKCDQAIQDIALMKMQAKNFVNHLNCEPAELRERFLNCMQTLDEYMYLITDFNLAVGKMDVANPNVDYTPVQDSSAKVIQPLMPALNIMDMLSEPAPSTSAACVNRCPVEHKRKKVPKEEQTLILFSSTSCSSESVPIGKVELEKKEGASDLMDNMKKLQIKDSSTPSSTEQFNLPTQTLLEMEHVYPATIMNIEGASLWVITDDVNATCRLMIEMTEYYKQNQVELSPEDMMSLVYCAYYDEENDCYCRGLVIRSSEGDSVITEVFLVDTGEFHSVSATTSIQPLAVQFYSQPPFARCCHLAGIDLGSFQNIELIKKQGAFLQQYIGMRCSIEVDDNSSESLGVYVILSETQTLNQLLVQQGLALSTENVASMSKLQSVSHGPPELSVRGSDIDITSCPEYEDPVEAVTGYSCRDEIDICKHYKGGPDKTCFKGPRCTKRHVLKHPDGWTLDRVEVLAKCRAAALPAPNSWSRALVTFICHYNRLYVQLTDDAKSENLPLPDFGVVLPPRTLDELIRDMNSPATRLAYKPLKMIPAPGELVAALYPLDDRWYRARIVSYSRADQNVEVMYIDYGNLVWLREDTIRALEPRLAMLPAQATRCVLAGVMAKSDDPKQWTMAKDHLANLVQDRVLDLHVIARDYDEITVELFDEKGNNIAEQLATLKVIKLKEYSVVDESTVTQKLVAA